MVHVCWWYSLIEEGKEVAHDDQHAPRQGRQQILNLLHSLTIV